MAYLLNFTKHFGSFPYNWKNLENSEKKISLKNNEFCMHRRIGPFLLFDVIYFLLTLTQTWITLKNALFCKMKHEFDEFKSNDVN